MDLTKGRKSKNILDRRPSNKDAYISAAGRKFADQEDFMDTYATRNKPRPAKLGDSGKLLESVDRLTKSLPKDTGVATKVAVRKPKKK